MRARVGKRSVLGWNKSLIRWVLSISQVWISGLVEKDTYSHRHPQGYKDVYFVGTQGTQS